jgi:predicted DNA-binding WGR domain protein
MQVQNLILSSNMQASFRLYLVFNGDNESNKSGYSYKFWEIAHSAGKSDVTITWGKVGSSGQSMTCPMETGLKKVREKLKGGYREDERKSQHFVDTTVVTDERLLAKLKSMPFPYNEVTALLRMGDVVICRDRTDHSLFTLTSKGVSDLMAA